MTRRRVRGRPAIAACLTMALTTLPFVACGNGAKDARERGGSAAADSAAAAPETAAAVAGGGQVARAASPVGAASGGARRTDTTLPRPTRTQNDSAALARMRRQITAAVGEPACSAVTQCRLLPLGAKPCGGPTQYLVFSTARSDSAALAALVRRYNELEKRRNARSGVASDCMMVAPPAVACTARRCVARPGAIGISPPR